MVDDDPDQCNLARRFLEGSGFRVDLAGSGAEALKKLSRQQPDLILLDVMLGDMTGYEVSEQLQQLPETAYIPIIFVTALDQQQDKARAFALGAVGYLTKPVQKPILLQAVTSCLESRRHWYTVRVASNLWDEAPLPQKFAQFRQILSSGRTLTPQQEEDLDRVASRDVYLFCRILDISYEELARRMALFFGLEYLPRVDPETIELGLLPVPFCRANNVVTIRDEAGEYVVVLANPFNWGLAEIDLLNNALRGRPYRMAITHRESIRSLFMQGATDADDNLALLEQISGEPQAPPSLDVLLSQSRAPSAIEMVNAMITDAARRGASDLHIQPERMHVKVRYRIDGSMREVMPFPTAQLPAIVSRVKVMCNLDIADTRRPQDGGMKLRIDGREIEIRVSSLPSTHGEKIVMRLLGQGAGRQKLEDLGLLPDMLRAFRRLLASKQGLILITGPTGSGKTTTLYAALDHLNSPDANIVTVEDPVERDIEGVTQVAMHEKSGRTFAATLRSMLRQDPDVIMVGEVRDGETAEIACRAALTGHLVLSTIHTMDTLSTMIRLIDMGVAPYLTASALSGIMAQRLVHRVCPSCAEPYVPPLALRRALEEQFGSLSGAAFRRGAGCSRCLHSGILGRTGIYELLPLDDDLRRQIVNGVAPGELRSYAARRGFRTLEEDAFRKAREGLIIPETILDLGMQVAMSVDEMADESVVEAESP